MPEVWAQLTDAQATLLAALITVVGAGLGVLLGWWLFRGKVKDLESALDRSRTRLEDHERDVGEKLEVINLQIAAILDALGEVRGGVVDIQAASERSSDTEQQADVRDSLKRSWVAIRDRLEAIASDHPDGRTRARYGRISRRNYASLIEALEQDNRLGGRGAEFHAANSLWQRFQRGRAVPTAVEADQMRQLCEALVPPAQ